MAKVIDLTHTITKNMPVHSFDEPMILERMRTLVDDKYNDWKLCSGMHVGTHIDGPGHLTDSDILISAIPVDKFIGKGSIIDARTKPIDASLLKKKVIEKDSIVLVFTGSDKHFGTDEYFNNHPILSADFAQELVNHHIKMVGIDFFSPDKYPFEIHKLFFDHDVLIIENLTNLESLLPVENFMVVALPLKTETDSSLARVIALVEA
jgi:kynurenine formamidase